MFICTKCNIECDVIHDKGRCFSCNSMMQSETRRNAQRNQERLIYGDGTTVRVDADELKALRESHRELLTIKAEINEHYAHLMDKKDRFPAQLFRLVSYLQSHAGVSKREI